MAAYRLAIVAATQGPSRSDMTEPSKLDFSTLTSRERDCLRLVTHERKSAVIADMLGIAPGTVDLHLKRARSKLGGMNRFKAADALRNYEQHIQSLDTPTLGIAATPLVDQPDWTGRAGSGKAASSGVAEAHATFDVRSPPPASFHPKGTGNDLSSSRRLMQMLTALLLLSLVALSARPIAQEFVRLADFAITHLRQ